MVVLFLSRLIELAGKENDGDDTRAQHDSPDKGGWVEGGGRRTRGRAGRGRAHSRGRVVLGAGGRWQLCMGDRRTRLEVEQAAFF